MLQLTAAAQSFLFAFSALFSIMNPIGSALIFDNVTTDRPHAERVWLAGKIAVYSAVVLLVSLWAGAYVLSFFGVSLAALRIGGGLVVASWAWDLFSAPERTEERKQGQAEHAAGEQVAFFPLTIPFTTGPGTISVAVTLGSNRPSGAWDEVVPFFIGVSAAALAAACVVWLAYRSAGGLVSLLGRARARVLARLMAFLMLCVGIQIMLVGVTDVLRPLLVR